MSDPNEYGAYVTDERNAARQAFTESRSNKPLNKSDYLYTALLALQQDPDYPGEGLRFSIANPAHITVAAGVVWTLGFWQSSTQGWYLLGKMAEVASFIRSEADFYIPLQNIADVPTS